MRVAGHNAVTPTFSVRLRSTCVVRSELLIAVGDQRARHSYADLVLEVYEDIGLRPGEWSSSLFELLARFSSSAIFWHWQRSCRSDTIKCQITALDSWIPLWSRSQPLWLKGRSQYREDILRNMRALDRIQEDELQNNHHLGPMRFFCRPLGRHRHGHQWGIRQLRAAPPRQLRRAPRDVCPLKLSRRQAAITLTEVEAMQRGGREASWGEFRTEGT